MFLQGTNDYEKGECTMAKHNESTTQYISNEPDWELRTRVMETFLKLKPNDQAYILGRMDGKIEAYDRDIAS